MGAITKTVTEYECKRCGRKEKYIGTCDEDFFRDCCWAELEMRYHHTDFGLDSINDYYCPKCVERFMKIFKLEKQLPTEELDEYPNGSPTGHDFDDEEDGHMEDGKKSHFPGLHKVE